ncbi:MAG: cation:proton antiporter [archaeon]|nr:cation:proton antiporter [archaeon]
MELGPILLMLVVLFFLARIASSVIERFGLPGLIGEIVLGIIIANVVIDGTSLLTLMDLKLPIPELDLPGNDNYSILSTFSELGVIFLLFSVGLETRVKDLLGSGKTAMFVAVLGVIIPFILGFVYIQVTDGNFHHAMFLAAAMVATSVGITAQVIKDMHLLDKKESRIIISAAVIDDVLGMVVLAIVKGTAGSSGGLDIMGLVIIIIEAVVFVLGVILIAKKGVPAITSWWVRMNSKRATPLKRPNALVLGLIACLFFAWLAEEIGLAAIIGSFLAGMLFADYAEETGLMHSVETLTAFFIPFFFVNVGMQVDVSTLGDMTVIITVIVVLIIALISKYLGCGLGAKLGERGLSRDSFNIIGIGMIPRGEVGIIVASIGLGIMVEGAPALSPQLYSVIVIMAVATTIIAPPLLSRTYRKKYPEVDKDEDTIVE